MQTLIDTGSACMDLAHMLAAAAQCLDDICSDTLQREDLRRMKLEGKIHVERLHTVAMTLAGKRVGEIYASEQEPQPRLTAHPDCKHVTQGIGCSKTTCHQCPCYLPRRAT